jgi:hypothetical protein
MKKIPTMFDRMGDGWFCEDCYAEFKTHFDACDHKWTPDIDDMGDDGQYCEKCSGFVRNEDFPSLFGRAASAQS